MSTPSTLTQVDSPAMTSEPRTAKPVESYTLPLRPWRRYAQPFEDILNHHYKGSGTEEDPYIIDWLPSDVEDPQRWPAAYKWSQIAVVSITTLAVALSSSAFSGAIESLIAEMGGSSELWTAGVSLFVVGFAFGPLCWAPASEVYGRRNVYIFCYFFLTLWQAVSIASPNPGSVLVFRALAGFFGSSPLANAGGSISDLLDAAQRGLGMALFAAAPFLGPALGPITGGFIGDAGGWKWVEAFLSIFCGVITVILFLFGAETYAPSLLRARAQTLSQATGKVYRFRADAKKPMVITALFKTSLIRPWKFLFLEPIVLFLSIYFAGYPVVFEEGRGWNPGEEGLAFLGILVGVVLSVIVAIFHVNPQYLKTVKKRGRPEPEDRLPPAIWAGVLIVIGLAGFAATDAPNVHWIAPIIFGIPFGLGMVVLFLAVLAYLVDTYTIYAASVLAANSALRSLLGAAFPLFTSYMYKNLGIHWAAALPGFLALACLPFPILFYKYGASIRAKCKYAADAQKTMMMIIAARRAEAEDEEKRVNGLKEAATAAPSPAGGETNKEKEQVQNGEKPIEEVPAEQAGGLGKVESNTETTATPHSHPSHPSHPAHKEWEQYEALADRDEVDLSDDERLRLESLHEQFSYEKAKRA